MKIKYQVPRGLRQGIKESSAYHWWLVPESPRKASRLPQMNRRNIRQLVTNLGLRRLEGSVEREAVA